MPGAGPATMNVAAPDAIDYTAAPSLARARQHSLALIEQVRAVLAAQPAPSLETVAVGGSLGRLEASVASDFDCLLVARDDASDGAVREDVERVMHALAGTGLALPKADGIYRQAVTRAALLDPAARGCLDEAPAVFGKRMQCLLDARPLAGDAAFARLRHDVVAWYAQDFVLTRPRRSWSALVNDLSRYLHAYAVWQQFKTDSSADDSWALRQAKLRSVRMLTFAGLLCLLGASNHREDKVTWLLARLDATPLERLAQLMREHHEAATFDALLCAYDAAHAVLADPAARAALVALPLARAQAASDPADGPYGRIRAASEQVMTLLTRFILARHGEWDERFFVRLVL